MEGFEKKKRGEREIWVLRKQGSIHGGRINNKNLLPHFTSFWISLHEQIIIK